MATYTQIFYHIVYSTKYRNPYMDRSNRDLLFKFIWGVLNKKKCHLYRINGVRDHIHLFTHLHPGIALSDLVKDVKLASSAFIKEQNLFKGFNGWQDGYSAFTHTIKEKHRLIEYIKNQEIHHKEISYESELKILLDEHGIRYNDKFLI
jgi:putative transposase